MTAGAIAITLGICLLCFAWLQRDRLQISRKNNSPSRNFRPRQAHLERKLLKLLGNNRRTAHRLIQQSRLRYPDKSADWHWEKAIYDLERDRWR
ncbi:hypothetical protein [Chamaesiphon sp. VAR_48_metabat_135_sub]|uniref:hypothetical protein n=1 Tax=Chamaesiphon sp. VAR_48_metabat_135_sub TaxID=2964699 RepID=UPI00286AFFF8|nr:hypothetical protein [Chamaesiphon sp. VAR_48_metabat_135_sub]